MKSPFLSVIIPVYNAELSLARCIESILRQNFNDIEVLLIDDGSTDSSIQICEEFVSKDSRVKIFKKDNGGVSSARNLGLKEACGEWITFVDSDDSLEESWLPSYETYNACDMIMQGFTFIDEHHKRNECHLSSEFYTGKDILQFYIKYRTYDYFPLRVPWNKFFRSSIIKENDICFNDSISCGEDRIFNLTYMKYVKNVRVVDNVDYIYVRSSSGLALKQYSVNDTIDWQITILNATLAFIDTFNAYSWHLKICKEYSYNLTRYLLFSISNTEYYVENFRKLYVIDGFFKNILLSKYCIAFLPKQLRKFIIKLRLNESRR